MAAAVPVKGKPGHYMIVATGEIFRAQELTEDSYFDTVRLPAGSVAVGTKRKFFDSLADKSKQHTNVGTVGRIIESQSEISVTRIGFIPAQATGNTVTTDDDILKLLYAGSLSLKFGKQEIATGPLWKYPGGYGAPGSTTRNDTGVVTNGIASPAAIPPLVVVQPLNMNDTVVAEAAWEDAAWSASYVAPSLDSINTMTLNLHGIKKTAVSR